MSDIEFTIVEVRRVNIGKPEIWHEAYGDGKKWFVQEHAGILQGGGTIFRREVSNVRGFIRFALRKQEGFTGGLK